MIFEQMDFFNVAELESVTGVPGLRMQRFPKHVRERLGECNALRGRFVSQASTGCEIRFVTEAPFFRIALSATVEDGDVLVYNGDFFHSMHRLKAGVIQTLHIEKPPRFEEVNPAALRQGRFAPEVWRIAISRNHYAGLAFQAVFHHLDLFGHEARPPRPEELPARRWLAYGSSITHGSGATMHHQAYIQQAARRLRMDVFNKGMGGSCFCEPVMADYLIRHEKWDVATLELGVNMRDDFTPEQFQLRAEYLVRGMLENNPGKPVVLVSLFPNSADHSTNPTHPRSERNEQFVQRLKQIYKSLDHPCLHYVDGHTLLTDFSALSADLIHPSDYGHTLIGQMLAEAMKSIIVPAPG